MPERFNRLLPKIALAVFTALPLAGCGELPSYKLAKEYHQCGAPEKDIPSNHLVYYSEFKREDIFGVFRSEDRQHYEDLGEQPPCSSTN